MPVIGAGHPIRFSNFSGPLKTGPQHERHAMTASAPRSDPWHPSACILCECNCGIEIQLGGEDGRRFTRVRGDKAHPASQGYACEKPSRLDYYQNGRDRVTEPLRRRADGSFEAIDWETAVREVAERFAAIRDTHGGESIFYYGGGGQGNHLPAGYARATRAVLGSAYRSNALAQEKTGEFWVSARMLGSFTRADFEHCEVGVFIGKNPWHSHSISRARVTLREISRDPERCLIVIDPRRSETADLADLHLQVKPGTDAWLLAAMLGILVQEDLLARDWLAAHTEGLDAVLPHFGAVPVGRYCDATGVPEDRVRAATRRIARASSAAFFEDLGVQMNRHSTLVSYLHRLLCFGTGNFAKKGAAYIPNAMQPLATGSPRGSGRTTPVTGARVISGLTPCNAIPDEILTDHPKRFRAMLIESANPAHSLADSPRMREALAALDLVVVIDVAMSETARLADYVLPVATQFEKAEATFFNLEFPRNYFHLRRPLLEPPEGLFSEAELHARLIEALGAMPEPAVKALREAWDRGRAAFRARFFELLGDDPGFFALAPVVLYRAIGAKLPHRLAEGAVLWALAQLAAQRAPDSIRRAGFEGDGPELGDQLFDAILAGERGVVFSVDDWEESWKRLGTSDGRIQLAVPELFEELDGLADGESPRTSVSFPFVLSAGERRSFTANTIVRNPDWRRKDRAGALRIHPNDAVRLGLTDGDRARLSTQRGSSEVAIEISDRMQPGHVSLPNGLGVDYPDPGGARETTGVAPNELTAGADRDWLAGTPWHKHVPARIEAL
jgi:anaerobic selenocysteine-containing dehydrogenase